MYPEDRVDGCVGHLFGDLVWVFVGVHYWEHEEKREEEEEAAAAAGMPAHWRGGAEQVYHGHGGCSLTGKTQSSPVRRLSDTDCAASGRFPGPLLLGPVAQSTTTAIPSSNLVYFASAGEKAAHNYLRHHAFNHLPSMHGHLTFPLSRPKVCRMSHWPEAPHVADSPHVASAVNVRLPFEAQPRMPLSSARVHVSRPDLSGCMGSRANFIGLCPFVVGFSTCSIARETRLYSGVGDNHLL